MRSACRAGPVIVGHVPLFGRGGHATWACDCGALGGPMPVKCPSGIRCHHLLKTFWTGVGGWAEKQFADGTVEWTSPSGHTYTTTPGGSLFFSVLATPTSELAIPNSIAERSKGRGVMMPRRRRTRKQERDERIVAERTINEQRLKQRRTIIDELEKHRQARADDDPPPF